MHQKSPMGAHLSWALVTVNVIAYMIHVIFIKPFNELLCPSWQPLLCFSFYSFCVLPLIVTSRYIQAASKHSQVSPEGILFKLCITLCQWKGSSAWCQAHRSGKDCCSESWQFHFQQPGWAVVLDVLFQLSKHVRARASIWLCRNWTERCSAASFAQFLQRRGRYRQA